jgi:gamma-glutamylcyclotransferase (GGCT)/AIG2-like uncharacterized protein YtfP
MNKYKEKTTTPVLVGVYGSLRKDLHNHKILGNSKLIGTFNTIPEYTMYDLGTYPGIVPDGNTSIFIEVYDVSETVLDKLDTLEGYHTFNSTHNHYNRRKIESPYGEMYIYFYNDKHRYKSNDTKIVVSGDWKDYNETKQLTN